MIIPQFSIFRNLYKQPPLPSTKPSRLPKVGGQYDYQRTSSKSNRTTETKS